MSAILVEAPRRCRLTAVLSCKPAFHRIKLLYRVPAEVPRLKHPALMCVRYRRIPVMLTHSSWTRR